MERKSRQKRPSGQRHGSSNASALSDAVQHAVPPDLQQSMLDVFTQAFPIISQPADFRRIMQEVKGHLYNRDFLAAFGKREYLDVYAIRWSAARALVYADIFTHPSRRRWFASSSKISQQGLAAGHASQKEADRAIQPRGDVMTNKNVTDETVDRSNAPTDPSSIESTGAQSQIEDSESSMTGDNIHTASSLNTRVKVVCIGGGAGAEVVALAATSRCLCPSSDSAGNQNSPFPASPTIPCLFEVVGIDIADWSEPVRRITHALTNPPPLSNFASQASRDVSRALLDTAVDCPVTISFMQQDILQAPLTWLRDTFRNATVITVMFTLNELFSSSLPKTTALLLNITEVTDVDTHLVVVDSPGSYSEIQLGTSSQPENNSNVKKYPMKWLLDHTLLNVAGKGNQARWTKLEDEDSKWFRINTNLGLKYGIDLENCRYQIHVFRKLK